MKSVIEKALDNIKNLNVQKLGNREQKHKNVEKEMPVYDTRPSLYISDDELSTIGKYRAGDKVVIVCECSVRSISSYDRMEGKDFKKTIHCDLVVDAIADITKG